MADDKANMDRGGEGVNFSLKNAKPETIMQRLDAQRERFAKQDAVAKQLNSRPTRQQLRRKGLLIALGSVLTHDSAALSVGQLERGKVRAPRSVRRKRLAELHRKSWQQRDKQAIQKLTGASQTR